MKPTTLAFNVQAFLLATNSLITLFPSVAAGKGSNLAGANAGTVHSISLSSASLALAYYFAVRRGDRAFLKLAVPGRLIAAGIFWVDGGLWRNVAIYEAVWGVVSAGVMWWEGW